jgi:galactosamine-6-phosphate isomerase
MTPQVFADYQALSRYAADQLVERLRQRPEALYCLATGTTPQGTYSLFAEQGVAEPSLVERMHVIKLDEWGGLAMDDPASCEQHLRRALIEPLRLENRYVALNSEAADPQAECARVATWLGEHGPIDTCVLGLGINGHLGFNEPAAQLQPHAHVAQLSAASLSHAMLEQARARPTCGLTLGMADILQARQVLLLVSGPTKQAPLRRLLDGRISTEFPASMLWLHPKVLLLCDSAACSAP